MGRILRPWPIALGLLLVVAAVLFIREDHRRQSLYWYEVTEDYRFAFEGPEVQRVPVRITGDGFSLPDWDGDWRTALLRIQVATGLSGRWFEPSVEVQLSDGRTTRQFFERRASGARYLSLGLQASDAVPGDTVRLGGRHLGWRDQDAELLLFSAPDPSASRILVLAPHADDAEIAAFGLYAGRESWVVTITIGSYGGRAYHHLVDDPAERETLQTALRIWDSLVVPRWGGLGPDRTLNLGYFTHALEPMYLEPERVVENPFSGSTDIARWRAWNHATLLDERPSISSWDNLVGDLVRLLERIRPEIVVSPHPALDGSPDHAFTTVALLEALQRLGDPPLYLFLYTNHHALSHSWPYGPADGAVTLPPWLDESTPFRSVYAHPLDREQQVAKLFALEATHDLRPPPKPVLGGPAGRVARRLAEAVADAWRDPARELSYFRRAARPNELFFVYRAEDRERLQRLIE